MGSEYLVSEMGVTMPGSPEKSWISIKQMLSNFLTNSMPFLSNLMSRWKAKFLKKNVLRGLAEHDHG